MYIFIGRREVVGALTTHQRNVNYGLHTLSIVSIHSNFKFMEFIIVAVTIISCRYKKSAAIVYLHRHVAFPADASNCYKMIVLP